MSSRQPIDEILEIKERGYGPASPAAALLIRVQLSNFVDQCKQALNERIPYVREFIPIRLATFLETYCKAALGDLVDFGEPFRSNARELLDKTQARVLLDAILAIHDERVTFGEIVSHSASYSRIGTIIGNFETVFGGDFKKLMCEAREYWRGESAEHAALIIQDWDDTTETIAELLSIRHVLVHEMPRDRQFKREALPLFCDHVMAFVDAADCAIYTKKHGHPPRSGNSTIEKAAVDLRAAVDELTELTREIQAMKKQSFSDVETEDAFRRFCEYAARAHAKPKGDKGNAENSLAYSTEFERLVRWRIDDLRRRKKRFDFVMRGNPAGGS